jgi:hypothetical protein
MAVLLKEAVDRLRELGVTHVDAHFLSTEEWEDVERITLQGKVPEENRKEVPLEPASTLLLNKVAAHLPGWKAAVGNDLGLAP